MRWRAVVLQDPPRYPRDNGRRPRGIAGDVRDRKGEGRRIPGAPPHVHARDCPFARQPRDKRDAEK